MSQGGYSSSKTFCVAPWVHFLTYVDGYVFPCCKAYDAVRNEDGIGYNIRHNSPLEIWNSEGYKKLRQSLLNGEEIPHCAGCYESERYGRLSCRQVFNRDYGERYLDQLIDQSDPLEVMKPIFVDIRLGNICNLRCRTCSPRFSSQIERDEIASSWVKITEQNIGKNLSDWFESADLMAELEDFCSDATRLVWSGGETTVNIDQIKLLIHLADKDISNKIDFLLVSNMTIVQDSFYDQVNKFKNPTVHISIEGIGRVNDYIRFPSKFQMISENIKKIQHKYKNITLTITPTYQAYNILYVCDMFDWCLENEIEFKVVNMLAQPSWLSFFVLPYAVRIIAAEKIEKWVESRSILRNVNNRKADIYNKTNESIFNMAIYLRDPNRQAAKIDIENFVCYTNDLDRSRGQDIRESLPELYKLWTTHYPWDHQAIRHFKSPNTVAAAPTDEFATLRHGLPLAPAVE